MDFKNTELIGYVASALVVVSLAMTSVVRLRAISLIGSIAFVAYGAMIGSVPIMVTNVAIAGLNLWFLRRELGGKRNLGALVVPVDDPFLVDFLNYHLGDIRRFQPDFRLDANEASLALLLMRDGFPAGALIGNQVDDELIVQLDHVIKPYRDSQISSWLYGRGSSVFRRLGIERISTARGTEAHNSYLTRNGFARVADRYVLTLTR